MSLLEEASGKLAAQSGFVVAEEWQPLLIGAAPNPSMTFDTFRQGSANDRLMKVMHDLFSEKETFRPKFVCIYGEPGIGKTHLLNAAAYASKGRAQLIHVADLEAEIARAKRLGALAECYKWLFHHEVLFFDGVDHTADNEIFESDFIHILDRMIGDGKTVVISSCFAPKRLSVSNSRLSSLAASGLLFSLRICDELDRYGILRRENERMMLPDEVLRYLAANVHDSIRRLKAAAMQIASMAGHSGAPANLDTARAVVPLPEDLQHVSRVTPDVEDSSGLLVSNKASFFREMLGEAETEAEQALALQIAISQRVREIRDMPDASTANETLQQLEEALSLLREGRLSDAMACLNPQKPI